MLGKLSEKYPSLDTPNLLDELLKREEEFTSLIGHGISLPHTYSTVVEESQVMVARIKPGIPCQHTGSDIELVFMLLSPEDQPVEHLNRISRIAKFVMKEQHRESLLHAIDEYELYDIINQA
jgi:mannitol/fructose-specific phosphotransferase system IIA component (Ntr-type)